jgi:dipeptidyl aminopeptidase/acylaminoacyl peptidase
MQRLQFVLTVLLALSATYSEARNLELTDYLEYESVSDPQISPDGRRIVYVRERVNKFTDSIDREVWQMDAQGAHNRFLLKGSQVRWSPDGTRIAYIAQAGDSRQLFVRWMDGEGSVSQITHGEREPDRLAWSPDGRSIAFRAQVPMEPGFRIDLPGKPAGARWTEDPPVIDRLHFQMDGIGRKTAFEHLFVVPADGGAARQLTSGSWDVGRRFAGEEFDSSFHWSPDGSHLFFSGDDDPAVEVLMESAQIRSVEVASGKMSVLFSEPGAWAQPIPSPDGKWIVFMGRPRSELAFAGTQLQVIRRDGSDSRVLLEGLTDSIFPVRWADQSDSLYIVLSKDGGNQIYRLSLEGKLTAVTQGTQRLKFSSISGDTAAGVMSKPHITPNIVAVNLRSGRMNQLTDVNADILSGVELGAVEEFWYGSTDATRVQGWIVTPPGFDPKRKYPLLLIIHGGPNWRYDAGFDFIFQEFAARGYVVLYTNPRGSTGYGIDFALAVKNAFPGRVDFDDLMAGVDSVLGRGYIDEKRLYVTGCSGGGTLTLWIVGHTPRFAAAVARCAISDWIGMAGSSDVAGWANNQFRPRFWDDPSPWRAHSPLTYAHRVTTPTLLMTGDKDLRTPVAQAQSFFSVLKHNGVDTALIPIHDEWHGTTTIPSNLLRTQLYSRKWFERHGGGSLPDATERRQ